jgi:hypothetical protein
MKLQTFHMVCFTKHHHSYSSETGCVSIREPLLDVLLLHLHALKAGHANGKGHDADLSVPQTVRVRQGTACPLECQLPQMTRDGDWVLRGLRTPQQYVDDKALRLSDWRR